MPNPIKNLAGLRFGRLIVECTTERRSKNGTVYWYCLCDCGKEVEIVSTSLTRKTTPTVSCGCFKIEVSKEVNTKHGHAKSSTKEESPEYRSWHAMMTRCYNTKSKDFQRYGARAIKVSKRWHTFDNFLKDMGLKPNARYQIDRVDNSKEYKHDNCRWATCRENINNRDYTIMLTHKGKTKPLTVWAEKYEISAEKVRQRLKRGWTIAESLAC